MSRTRVLDLAALPQGVSSSWSSEGWTWRSSGAARRSSPSATSAPTKGGNLCDGRIEGDIVTCPLHGWEFDLRSGVCMTIPGETVPRFAVTVDDGAIYLEESA